MLLSLKTILISIIVALKIILDHYSLDNKQRKENKWKCKRKDRDKDRGKV